MSSMTFFILFVCILAGLFLVVNLLLAQHNPYSEKASAFECGFHSYLQTRLPFNISFFIFGLLFLLFDLEILLIYPYSVSAYFNETMGLSIFELFMIVLTIGFAFELGKGALYLPSKQTSENTIKKDEESIKQNSLLDEELNEKLNEKLNEESIKQSSLFIDSNKLLKVLLYNN